VIGAVDWIIPASAAVGAFVTIGGAFYIRGKLDAHVVLISQRLETLEDGRVDDGKSYGTEIRQARELAVTVDARLNAHEQMCDRRQADIARRFDQVDRSLNGIRAEIRNMVLGLANSVRELPRKENRDDG